MSKNTLPDKAVTDTIALVLHLEARRMGTEAETVFAAVETGEATVYIPAMVLAEILYLSERGRIQTSLSTVQSYLKKYSQCRVYPLDWSVVEAARNLTDIPELHDRLIAATASVLGIPLLTNDRVIAAAKNISTIW